VNVLDVFDEDSGLTLREVLWLVEHLPEDSATVAAMKGGPEHRPWTSPTHLLAAQTNILYAANRQRAGKATRTPLIKPPVTKKKVPERVVDLKAVKARMARRARMNK
jgi:hypothetical protein